MNDKEKFIADLYPAVIEVSKETGMSAELILSQAALESGWGQKQLPGYNIFGIKADSSWHGPSQLSTTHEVIHGERVQMDQVFRVYGSYKEALLDRVKFLQENPRYTKAGLFDEGVKGNFRKEADALQKAGYSTSTDPKTGKPNYADAVTEVFNGPTMQRAIRNAKGLEQGESSTTLKQGTHGEPVKRLQTELTSLGYQDTRGHPLKADGVFGVETRHAVERFQHDHHLTVDGKVGPNTAKALKAASTSHAQVPSLTDAKHPDHLLYQQAYNAVTQLDAQLGRTPDIYTSQLAGALVVAAKENGLHRIGQVLLSEDGSRAFAVVDDLSRPNRQVAFVDTATAVQTPLTQSSVAAASMQPPLTETFGAASPMPYRNPVDRTVVI